MMDSIPLLAFPYVQSSLSHVLLSKLFFTNSVDTVRYSLILDQVQDYQQCISISKINTETKEPIGDLINYIQNPSRASVTPLLVRLPASYNRMKLNISIKPVPSPRDRSLVILKTLADNDEVFQLRELLQDPVCDSKRIEVSKLQYTDLPVDYNNNDYQRIIINDTFNKSVFEDNMMNISLWEFSLSINEYTHLFNFKVWIDENIAHDNEVPLKTKQGTANDEINEVDTQSDKHSLRSVKKMGYAKLIDYKNAFNFNIEDGPEFRETLKRYEAELPAFKKICGEFIDQLKNLELYSKKLKICKTKAIELMNDLVNLQFNSLLDQFNFKKDFKMSINAIFEPFERNLQFFIRDVCDNKLLAKISSTLSNNIVGSESGGSNELLFNKKQFENHSKEYYSWLNKYLSNEKERPELKLLIKRKNFELSKFDYLNHFNQLSNNQYFNQLLENLFKFINLRFRGKYLQYEIFNDVKLSQHLLVGNYEVYLTALSKFNSEKFQFRQIIEACQSNEELTNVITYNRLKHSLPSDNTEPWHDGNQYITKDNLDLIFANNNNKINTITATPILSNEDQNTDMAGVLFTLGGQGKQGWHKEWVVLNHGQLKEYSDWRMGKVPINKPIEIALSSIKPINYEKRHFCFEIFTSLGNRHVFQAINEDERNKWIKALYNAGQVVDTARLSSSKPKGGRENQKLGLITDFDKPLSLGTTLDSSLSPVSITSKSPLTDKDYLKLIRSIPNSDNNICSDCGSTDSVEWVSINFLVVFCVQCSSAHRHLGSHISRIRSLKLDNFENENKLLLKYINNRVVNEYLELNLPAGKKIRPNSTNEDRLEFIKRKYLLKSFKLIVDAVDDLLVKSIQKIEINEALKYIFCGGDINMNVLININSAKGFRTISLFEYSLRKYIEVIEGMPQPKKFFVISELLILNGCRIDNLKELNTEINLPEEAIEYWKSRSLKLSGLSA